MLQWMGGSRRKVTNSRKSTQKRQKQYFEQRRRQHQQPFEGGNYFEGTKASSQHNENNRSLDVLSLMNLSTVAQEHTSSCPLERDKSEVDGLNYQTVQHPPVIQTNKVKPLETSEIKEERTSSSNQAGTAYQRMVPVSSPPHHAKALNRDDDKMNQLMPPDHQLSVIDILGDDEPNTSSTKILRHETHAAFSIQGLGEVETETPIHSPEAYSSTFLCGHSSQSKAPKPAHSFKDYDNELVNLESDLDAMMQGIDIPLCRSSVEQSFYSKDAIDVFGVPKQKLLAFQEFSLFNDCANDLCDLVGNDELIYQNKRRSTWTWDASSTLPGNIIDESGYGISERNWMGQFDASADFSNPMDYGKKHFSFGSGDCQDNRTTTRKASKQELLDSPAPNLKFHKLENNCNFMFPGTRWHSPLERCHDVRDLTDEPMDSCFISGTEDREENLSLPSEESCSSTAARGAAKKTILNLKEIQSTRNGTQSAKIFRERNSNNWNPPLQGESINGSVMFTSMSRPSRSKPVPELNTTLVKGLKPYNSKLFEAVYDPGETSSGCNACCEASGEMKHLSSSSRHPMEDFLGASEDPKLHNSRSFFESIPSLSQDSNVGHRSFHAQGSLKPEKESIIRATDEKSDFQVTGHGKSLSQGDMYDRSKSLSSEDGKSTDASDSEVNCSDLKED